MLASSISHQFHGANGIKSGRRSAMRPGRVKCRRRCPATLAVSLCNELHSRRAALDSTLYTDNATSLPPILSLPKHGRSSSSSSDTRRSTSDAADFFLSSFSKDSGKNIACWERGEGGGGGRRRDGRKKKKKKTRTGREATHGMQRVGGCGSVISAAKYSQAGSSRWTLPRHPSRVSCGDREVRAGRLRAPTQRPAAPDAYRKAVGATNRRRLTIS